MRGKRYGSKFIVFSLLYLVLAVFVIYAFTSGGMGISTDSERYLNTAHLLETGEGGEAVKTAYPHSPMFYPLIIAAVQSVGLSQGAGAGRIVGMICFAISVVMVFFIGLRIQGEPTAHLSAISVLILAPLLYTFSYCWSETLYITLSLAFLLLLISYLYGDKAKDAWFLVGAAAVAGLGFVTRYIGLSLIITGLVAMIFFAGLKNQKRKLGRTLLFGVVGIVPMVVNLIAALTYVGKIERESVASRFSLVEQFARLVTTLYHDFLSFDLSFREYIFLLTDLAPDKGQNIVWLCLSLIVLSCLVVFIIAFIRLFISRPSFRKTLRSLSLPGIYIVIYVLILMGTSSIISVDPLGSRFAVPIYPIITILVFSGVFHVLSAFKEEVWRRLLFGLMILGTCLFCCIQLVSSASIFSGISSGSFPAMEQPGNRKRSSLQYLERTTIPNDVIVTNIPQKLHYIWPRGEPYWSFSKLELSQKEVKERFVEDQFFFLLCPEDRSTDPLLLRFEKEGKWYNVPMHNLDPGKQAVIVEEKSRREGYVLLKIVRGFDYIYKLTKIEEIDEH